MKKYIRRYIGKKISIFTNGGWSFHGEIIPALCTKSVVVLLQGTEYVDVEFDSIVATSTIMGQVQIPAPSVTPWPTEGFAQAVPVRTQAKVEGNKPKRKTMDELVEEYKEDPGVSNTYGSILPADMLEGEEEENKDVDLSMSFSAIFGDGE